MGEKGAQKKEIKSRLKQGHRKFWYYSLALLKTGKYLKQTAIHINFPPLESTQTTSNYETSSKFRLYSKLIQVSLSSCGKVDKDKSLLLEQMLMSNLLLTSERIPML